MTSADDPTNETANTKSLPSQWFPAYGNAHSFINNQACALRYVVAGLQGAIIEVAEHLNDLESPPTDSQDNVSKIPGPD